MPDGQNISTAAAIATNECRELQLWGGSGKEPPPDLAGYVATTDVNAADVTRVGHLLHGPAKAAFW